LFENETGKSLARKIAPRIAKAVIKGLLYFIFLYLIPTYFIAQLAQFSPQLFVSYGQLLKVFVTVIIFFVVASELTAGTIFQHAFNIGRALILILFILLALQGGIVNLTFQIENQPLNIVADLRIYLLMLITIDLLGLARSILQAVNFLSQQSEKQLPAPQPTN
jgi:hypothetical protein